MLLLGFALLFTVLAAADDNPEDRRIKVCIEDGKVKSSEPRVENEILTSNCSALYWIFPRNSYEILYLHRRNITSFEKDWYRLQDYQIRSIELSFNDIKEITSELLNDLPASITEVSLRHNKIEYLRSGIIENEHLTSLHLAYNCIHEIESGSLEKTPQLKFLNLGHNQLNNTKFAATLPTNLRQMWLSSNAITEIADGSFSRLDKLWTLTLESNNITKIQQQAFQGLERLSYLVLLRNPIESVEKDSFEFNSLYKVVRIDEA